MIAEGEFKMRLINKLNYINLGWRDGDLDKFDGSKADIVSDILKIAIEIKDDFKYEFTLPPNGEMRVGSVNSTKKNRQFKDDFKSANKKFLNYPEYKTILILRTEMVDFFMDIIDYSLDGPLKINVDTKNVTRPSTFWGDHDNSINEIGVILFWSNKIFYKINNTPNLNKDRVVEKHKLENIFGLKFET